MNSIPGSTLSDVEDDGVELLLSMSATSTGELAADLNRALELATKFFGLEFGIISRVDGDRYFIENVFQPEDAGLKVGQGFELGKTYCAITLQALDVISIDEMRTSQHSGHPCYDSFHLESYLGVPLRVDGEIYGTINFSSPERTERPWTETERQLVRLLANWVEGSIAQDRLGRRLADALSEVDRANQALVSRNQDLDDFARHASHDLQAPLRNVTGLMDMLAEDLGEGHSAQVEEDMGMVRTEIDRMLEIVRALLSFSRASDGDLATDSVPLNKCVDAACEALKEFIKEADAEIVHDPLPSVSGDSTLLTQVFQNLIGNAIKFQSPGAKPRVEITARQVGDQVEASVADNGIGIDEKYAELIFAPLQRLHGAGTFKGSGLGLSICRKIVQRHGGAMRLESAANEGATFTLTFAADPEQAAAGA